MSVFPQSACPHCNTNYAELQEKTRLLDSATETIKTLEFHLSEAKRDQDAILRLHDGLKHWGVEWSGSSCDAAVTELARMHAIFKAQGERHAKRCEEWAKTADEEREAKESALLQVDVLEKDNAALREELKRMGGCTCGNTPYRWHNDECPKKDEEKAVRNICPTCGGEAKFEIIDGKCKACRLGVVQDWMKPKGTVNRLGLADGSSPAFPHNTGSTSAEVVEKRKCVHPGEYADSGRVFCTECKERLI